jgi:hypothetical protein
LTTPVRPQCAQPETIAWQGFCAEKVYHGGDICIVRHQTSYVGIQGAAPSGATGGEQVASPEEKDKPSTTLQGTVQKIIKPVDPHAPDTAEIAIEGAEDLYREIRVENTLKNQKGEEVALKRGAPVDVTIEAEEKDTAKKAE